MRAGSGRPGTFSPADDAPNGPTYLEALDKFRKLVAQGDKIGTDDYLVSALLNQYRAHLKTTRKSGAPGVFEVMARRFADKFGKHKVAHLKPYAFDQWSANDNQPLSLTYSLHGRE